MHQLSSFIYTILNNNGINSQNGTNYEALLFQQQIKNT